MHPTSSMPRLVARSLRRAARPLAGLLLASACAAVWPAARGTGAKPVTLNFPEADVDAISRVMAEILGRAIVLDPRVKGKLRLYTEQPVSPAQAYAIFSSSLRGLGFAVVEANGLLKIVPEADAKLQSGTVTVEPAAGRGDQVLTQIFRLTYESANNLVPALRPLIGPNNTINVNAGNNSLVITDYASNLARLGQIIAALDTPSATDVEVMPLQYALASELAVTVQRMSEGSGAAAQGGAGTAAGTTGSANAASSGSGVGASAIVADSHLNALLVRAANPARLAAIRALVARLDQPGGAGVAGSNVHVIYLKNAEATRLATVLRAAFSAEALRTAGAGLSASGAGGSGSASSASASGNSRAGGVAGVSSVASSTGSSESSQATSPVVSSAQPSTGGYIQADPASNALIITAPEPLFRQLRAVVDLLDSRRAQLYVESLVVEVDASKALDVGLQWKQLFNISSTTELTLGTVAQAIESVAGTNILSTANLMTLDNEEAKIVVGQNVPFVTGSYTSTSSSTTSPFQTIERKDVGLTLRIRPQIGPNGSIRMTIFQESSSVSSTTTPGTSNAGPTTNKRSIESTVLVNDGKIIVLGGLIEDSYSDTADQVPLLAELPMLGNFFRTLSRSRKKTNLMVFLRPIVMPDDNAANAVSIDRYDYIRARQQGLPVEAKSLALEAGAVVQPVSGRVRASEAPQGR